MHYWGETARAEQLALPEGTSSGMSFVKCVVVPVSPGMKEQRDWHSWGGSCSLGMGGWQVEMQKMQEMQSCISTCPTTRDLPWLLSSQGSGESTAWEGTAYKVIPIFQLRHKKGNIAHVFKQIPGFEVKYRKSHIRCDIWQPFLRAGCWEVRRINGSLKPGLGCGQGLPCQLGHCSSPAASAFPRIKGKNPRPVSMLPAWLTEHSFSTLFAQVSLYPNQIFSLSLLCSPVTAHSSSPDTDHSSPDFVWWCLKFKFHGIKIPKHKLELKVSRPL